MNLVKPPAIRLSENIYQGLYVSNCCPRLEIRRSYARASFRPALVDEELRGKKLSPFADIEIPEDTPSKRQKWTFSLPYPSLNDYKKAKQCVSSLDPAFYKNTTVIEINPGLGLFTRALYNQIKPKNYVIFDRYLTCAKNIKPLVDASKGVIKHFDLDGWDFNSYTEIIKRKLITPEIQKPSKINSSLIFVGNFTESNNRRSDGLVAQIIPFMLNKIFLYHYGLVKTLIWMESPGWQSLVANPGHTTRKKITVMTEMACEAQVIARNETRSVIGRIERPLPTTEEDQEDSVDSKGKKVRSGIMALKSTHFTPPSELALIELTPLPQKRTRATLEELEYLTLKLFMVDAQPVSQALKIVAPGAEILAKAIEPCEPRLSVSEMTIEHWIKLADAFHDWVFKPDVLQDESYVREDIVEDQQQASIHAPSEISDKTEASLLAALAREGREADVEVEEEEEEL